MLKKLHLDYKREQAELVRTIGQRLREARELCNLSQQTAALKLGYKNSSKLAKIENATDTNSVPLWLVNRASKLYGVSVDFLFGLNEDWEKSARLTIERQTGLWLNEQWERMRRRDLFLLQNLSAKIDLLDSTIFEYSTLAKSLNEALEIFRKINPVFDEMRGGSRLLTTTIKMLELANNAESKMKKFKRECFNVSQNTSFQLELFHEKNEAKCG